MKKTLVLMAVMAALPFAAFADQSDSTTATSTTTLNITVVAPVTLTCDSSISFHVVQHAGSGVTNSAGQPVACVVGGGTVVNASEELLTWQVTDLTDSSTDTLPATSIAASPTNGSFVAAVAASTPATITDTTNNTVAGSYSFYLQAQVPAAQVAARYSGTMTVVLTVTYIP